MLSYVLGFQCPAARRLCIEQTQQVVDHLQQPCGACTSVGSSMGRRFVPPQKHAGAAPHCIEKLQSKQAGSNGTNTEQGGRSMGSARLGKATREHGSGPMLQQNHRVLSPGFLGKWQQSL